MAIPVPSPLPDAAAADRPRAVEMPPLAAAALLAGRKEVTIAHAGALYRLRLTRQNKLILTK